MDNKLKEVEYLVNTMISLCEPVAYDKFNVGIKAKDIVPLREFEKDNPVVGIAKFDTPEEGVSTLSIIATITDILVGQRLSFIVEEDRTISGVRFLKPGDGS